MKNSIVLLFLCFILSGCGKISINRAHGAAENTPGNPLAETAGGDKSETKSESADNKPKNGEKPDVPLSTAIELSKEQKTALTETLGKLNTSEFVGILDDTAKKVIEDISVEVNMNEVDKEAQETGGDYLAIYYKKYTELTIKKFKVDKEKPYLAYLLTNMLDAAKNKESKDLFQESKNLAAILKAGDDNPKIKEKIIEYIQSINKDEKDELEAILKSDFKK
jgi:hypothetical protein